jgi:CRP/FNR family transcriptional regulator, cyclic AMP receptor protein
MSRDRVADELARVPLFSGLSKKHLQHLSSLATTIEVEPGRVLAAEGEPGREFVVVLSGEAEVRRNGEFLAKRSSGDFFGEISLLLDKPRTASVVATTPMTIGVIESREFKAMLQENPELYEPLIKAVGERIVLKDDHNLS